MPILLMINYWLTCCVHHNYDITMVHKHTVNQLINREINFYVSDEEWDKADSNTPLFMSIQSMCKFYCTCCFYTTWCWLLCLLSFVCVLCIYCAALVRACFLVWMSYFHSILLRMMLWALVTKSLFVSKFLAFYNISEKYHRKVSVIVSAFHPPTLLGERNAETITDAFLRYFNSSS